jgi:hypothetical protein
MHSFSDAVKMQKVPIIGSGLHMYVLLSDFLPLQCCQFYSNNFAANLHNIFAIHTLAGFEPGSSYTAADSMTSSKNGPLQSEKNVK